MKLQIKTLNQKSLFIEIEDSLTVYDLKKELSLYPDVGVGPELQKIIYAGKILTNENPLSAYNIDVKKFLVVMVLKQPLTESSAIKSSTTTTNSSKASSEVSHTNSNANAVASASSDNSKDVVNETPKPTSSSTPTQNKNTSQSKDDSLLQTIVNMGYPEDQVRCALEASFNNPERAIEYLIEGIPTSSAAELGSFTDGEPTTSPFEVFRSDPLFQNLRRLVQQHPDLINEAVQCIGETNPALMSLIDENQQEFLSMLIEAGEDDDNDEDGDGEGDDDYDDDESEDVV